VKRFLSARNSGYTILEVIMAIFIFGCISAAVYRLLSNTDRLRGRAIFVKTATRFAATEAELLRNIAAQNGVFEDSSYVVVQNGRSYTVNRKIIEDETFSFQPKAREPEEIEITVTDTRNENIPPLSFKLLIGVDDP
jgi:prepilin-type N-terminal cleavage/methylation domain-containing protein